MDEDVYFPPTFLAVLVMARVLNAQGGMTFEYRGRPFGCLHPALWEYVLGAFFLAPVGIATASDFGVPSRTVLGALQARLVVLRLLGSLA